MAMNREIKKLAEKAKADNDVYTYAILIELDNLNDKYQSLDDKLTSNFASKDELAALKQRVSMLEKIVYGAVGLILIAVFGALIALVVRT